jgi:hypothetical protein
MEFGLLARSIAAVSLGKFPNHPDVRACAKEVSGGLKNVALL